MTSEHLERVLADVAERRDRGERIDPSTVIAAHPEIEGPLRAALGALDLLDLEMVEERIAATAIPEEIGPYRVTARIGSGGMGTVYAAEVRQAVAGCEPGTPVALKVVHPHLLERPGFFKRFLREAEAGRSVDHEHVVRTLDADAVRVAGDTVHFLVMEYVEGQTLADLLEELGVVPESLLREIALQMAHGLGAIHEAGLVHRDLKPENALITPDHVVRLMDLGVARPLATDDALTEAGQFAGSLPYAAPEQFGDHTITAAADLYSLGVTLYELATGVCPFRRDDMASVMAAHREHVPEALHEIRPEVSAFFSELVTTLLAKQPTRRFASSSDVSSILTEGEHSAWWREQEKRRPRAVARARVPVRRDTELYGRDEDLAALRDAWDAARAGDGRMVLLEGEAGIGKSRLVDAFLQALTDRDAHVLYGSYPPTGGMGGISDAIIEHFGTRALEEVLRPYLTTTPNLVDAFAASVRHEPAADGAGPLAPEARQSVLVQLMRSLAADKPLVWIVDDLHFADEDSRSSVLSLARALEGHRVLLVGTTRPGAPEDWLAHLARVEGHVRRTLGRLSPREIVLLLQDAFGSDLLAEKLGVRIALKSDGIPFFVFEMIRGLRDGQFITQLPDGTWAETRVVEHIEVPSAVRDLVEARLRGLSDEHRAILDVGAVDGFEFDPDLVARVLDRSRIAVLQDLASMERRSSTVHGERGRCRFDHHQLQEVLYENMPPDLRAEYHLALANALEQREDIEGRKPGEIPGHIDVTLCRHLLLGDAGQRALRHLEPAQAHLTQLYRHEEVIDLGERALEAPELLCGADRATVLVDLCHGAGPLQMLGRPERAGDLALEACRLAETADDRALRERALAALGHTHLRLGRFDEARACFRDVALSADARSDVAAGATAAGSIGTSLQQQGRLADAQTYQEQALSLFREAGDREGEAKALGNLAIIARSSGRLEEAVDRFETVLSIADALGSVKPQSVTTVNLGIAYHDLGRLDDAQRMYERYLELSRAQGDRVGEARAIANLGALHLSRDELAEAEERVLRAHSLSREIGDRRGESHTLANLGLIYGKQGRLAEARDSHERHLEFVRELGDLYGQCIAHQNLAPLLRAAGDETGAEAQLESATALAQSVGDRYEECAAHLTLGQLRRDLDRDLESRASLVAARDIADDVGVPSIQVIARCTLAMLPGGDADDAARALRELSDRLTSGERMDANFFLWKATGDAAYLSSAKTMLNVVLDRTPEAHRGSLLARKSELVDACRDRGMGFDAGSSPESPTRAG